MSGFVAIILICQLSLPAEACDEASARDVMSIRVDNEIGCTTGWQDVVGALAARRRCRQRKLRQDDLPSRRGGAGQPQMRTRREPRR
jgi:hypothetical protein